MHQRFVFLDARVSGFVSCGTVSRSVVGGGGDLSDLGRDLGPSRVGIRLNAHGILPRSIRKDPLSALMLATAGLFLLPSGWRFTMWASRSHQSTRARKFALPDSSVRIAYGKNAARPTIPFVLCLVELSIIGGGFTRFFPFFAFAFSFSATTCLLVAECGRFSFATTPYGGREALATSRSAKSAKVPKTTENCED